MRISDVKVVNYDEEGVVITYGGSLTAEKSKLIKFTAENETKLELWIYLDKNGVWKPARVNHHANSNEKRCELCGSRLYGGCRSFIDEKDLNQIFEEMMNHPAVRLRKIFG